MPGLPRMGNAGQADPRPAGTEDALTCGDVLREHRERSSGRPSLARERHDEVRSRDDICLDEPAGKYEALPVYDGSAKMREGLWLAFSLSMG